MENSEREAPALLSLSLSQCRFAIYSCIIVRGRTRVRLHKCVSVRADVGVCLRVCVCASVWVFSTGLSVLVDVALYAFCVSGWPKDRCGSPAFQEANVRDL